MVKTKIFVERTKIVLRVLSIWFLGVVFGGSFVFVSIEGREFLDEALKSSTITIERAEAYNVPVIEEKPAQTIVWNQGEFSAYTSAEDETDENPNIMASGKSVYLGAIACPRSMKLGTVIELENGKRYTCEDRMHVRYTNHFDIYMETKAEAFTFGRKSLKYQVIK